MLSNSDQATGYLQTPLWLPSPSIVIIDRDEIHGSTARWLSGTELCEAVA
jgi:hypothetical protein